jgi:hypothetical protein
MTAVAGATFTAAQFNQYVRDNLNQTAPALASAASQIFVSTGANAIVARTPSAASISTDQTTASTTFADLATVGPQISVATGTIAIVLFSASMMHTNDNNETACSVAVSGASSVAASNAWQMSFDGNKGGNYSRGTGAHVFTGLTAGTNTFTMKYRVGALATGHYQLRELNIIPL